MSLLASLRRAIEVCAATGHDAALVGGLAVSARAEPRFTRDADLAVAVFDDAESEQLVHHFLTSGFTLRALLEHTGTARMSGARLQDEDGVDIDVLTASSGIELEVVAQSEVLEIVPGLTLPVARVGHLIALKLLSVAPGRETDAADLRALAQVATDEEWTRATQAVEMIGDRGFSRGRDLQRALTELRTTAG